MRTYTQKNQILYFPVKDLSLYITLHLSTTNKHYNKPLINK